MSAHLKYLRYVAKHKWFVFLAGLRLRVPVRQLVMHDWQKFMPTEWFPYVSTFYGNKPSPRRADGGYNPNAVSPAFDYAWLHHQKVGGKHHWQYWVLPEDDGGLKTLPMPDRFVREMVADWRGAGRALGHGDDVIPWYRKNRDNMHLAASTRRRVEALIGYQDGTP